MWSWESTATPETWPRIQLFGRCFGQYGSGSYFGSCGAAAPRPVTMNPIEARAASVCDLISDLQERPTCRAEYITSPATRGPRCAANVRCAAFLTQRTAVKL